MVILIIFICAVALAYLSLTEDEEENLPPKCSNCANCTKNKKQDNLYPYCSRRDMFLMNIEKSAKNCAFYEVKGLNLGFKSFFAIMIIATILLGVF